MSTPSIDPSFTRKRGIRMFFERLRLKRHSSGRSSLCSPASGQPRLIWRSAPSFSSCDHQLELLGTRTEVMACLCIQRCWRRRAAALPMEWAHLVTRHQTRLKVTLPKPTKGSRFGFMMRTDVHRVFVRTVDPGSAAAPLLLPFDELLSINGQKCVSTVQAAQLFGAAPKGKVDVEVSRPAALEGAVHRIQTCLRNALARRLGFGVVRRVLFKPE